MAEVRKMFTPADLGLASKDLTSAGGTAWSSQVLNLLNVDQITLEANIHGLSGSPTAGAVKLSMQQYVDGDGLTALGPAQDLLTAISSQADARHLVSFGRHGSGEVGGGTVGTEIGSLKDFRFAKFTLTVSTQGNATTSLGSVTLLTTGEVNVS